MTTDIYCIFSVNLYKIAAISFVRCTGMAQRMCVCVCASSVAVRNSLSAKARQKRRTVLYLISEQLSPQHGKCNNA